MAGYTFTYWDQNNLGHVLNDNLTRFLNRDGMRGFGFPAGDVTTQRVPYTHGTALVSTTPYAQPREMQLSLTLKVASGGTYQDLRNEYTTLVRNLSPWKGTTRTDINTASVYTGTLWVTRPDGNIRAADCWCTNVSDLEEDGPYAGAVTVTFMAPYPFFYDPINTGQALFTGVAATGLTWPITFPITFTSGDVDSDFSADNTGEAETWPLIQVHGPGDNPVIENSTTGKSWSCTQTMDAGDYITVNMARGTVTMYDATGGTTASILDTMDTTAEFWPLIQGDNTIHVEIENVDNVGGIMTFYLYYLTV